MRRAADVAHDDTPPSMQHGAACGLVVLDDAKKLEEGRIERALRDDAKAAVLRDQLNVAEVRTGDVNRQIEDTVERRREAGIVRQRRDAMHETRHAFRRA